MKSNGRAGIQTEGSQNPKFMSIPHTMLPPSHRGLQFIEHVSQTLLSEMMGCLNEGEFSAWTTPTFYSDQWKDQLAPLICTDWLLVWEN